MRCTKRGVYVLVVMGNCVVIRLFTYAEFDENSDLVAVSVVDVVGIALVGSIVLTLVDIIVNDVVSNLSVGSSVRSVSVRFDSNTVELILFVTVVVITVVGNVVVSVNN